MAEYIAPPVQFIDKPAELLRHRAIGEASQVDQAQLLGARLAVAEHQARMDTVTMGWLLLGSIENIRKTGLALLGLAQDAPQRFGTELQQLHAAAIDLANNVRELYQAERISALLPSAKRQEKEHGGR